MANLAETVLMRVTTYGFIESKQIISKLSLKYPCYPFSYLKLYLTEEETVSSGFLPVTSTDLHFTFIDFITWFGAVTLLTMRIKAQAPIMTLQTILVNF